MTNKFRIEDEIRRIVREELKSLLMSMKDTAYNADEFETGGKSAGFSAIRDVVEQEAALLPHDWSCEKRKYRNGKCTCGVGETD